MTEGGKSSRDELVDRRGTGFAPLRPLVADGAADAEPAVRGLAEALVGVDRPGRIQLRLVEGEEAVETWDVQPGSSTRANGEGEPELIVVLSPATWNEIAAGRLAPYDALFAGRMRVGGDVELGKRVTRHLSHPGVPYTDPC